MRNRMYGGVRGRKTKVGEKLLRFPPTRLVTASCLKSICSSFLLPENSHAATATMIITIMAIQILLILSFFIKMYVYLLMICNMFSDVNTNLSL